MERLDTYRLFQYVQVVAAVSMFRLSSASSAASLSLTQDSLYLDKEYIREYH